MAPRQTRPQLHAPAMARPGAVSTTAGSGASSSAVTVPYTSAGSGPAPASACGWMTTVPVSRETNATRPACGAVTVRRCSPKRPARSAKTVPASTVCSASTVRYSATCAGPTPNSALRESATGAAVPGTCARGVAGSTASPTATALSAPGGKATRRVSGPTSQAVPGGCPFIGVVPASGACLALPT